MHDAADVGVFGGSGLYRLIDDVIEIEVETPYGPPSAPVHVADVGGRRVAFLPRHGSAHEYPPHRIPYRANVWAMRSLGVERILAPCASGSLQPPIRPGEFVVPDQLVDRTANRDGTFFDGPEAHHIAFADPYCDALARVAVAAGRAEGITVHDGGTVVVVPGPRFSTRAESRSFRREGWEVVNMTQAPEAALAREAGLHYAAIALITDYDTGVEGDDVEPVTQDEVFAFFAANVERVRAMLFRAIAEIPTDLACTHDPGGGPLDLD